MMFNQNNNNNYLMNLNQLLSMGQNPQQILQNAIASNPQLQQIFSQMGNQKLSTKDVVMQLAQKRGIDLNPMIQMLQQKGFKL